MKRAVIMVLDSLGIGATRDAHWYADAGSNTLLHVAQACANGKAEASRHGPLHLPHLEQLGLGLACEASGETFPPGFNKNVGLIGSYGFAEELSVGKDTASGHWELAGVPVMFDWGHFMNKTNSFPAELLLALCEKLGLAGTLANCHGDSMALIQRYGEEHIRTGKPICYTNQDSIMQIAAHEQLFGLARLHEVCLAARQLCDKYHIARVVARPFVGSTFKNFVLTDNQRDYCALPPAPTVLDKLVQSGGNVYAVGRVGDIFSHQGISKCYEADVTQSLFDVTLEALKDAGDNTIIMSNFMCPPPDLELPHDVSQFACELEQLDQRLPELMSALGDGDLMIITADHGGDPTWQGAIQTRENIPVLMYGKSIQPGNLGRLSSFSDVGQTLADYFHLPAMEYGQTLLRH